MTYKILKINGEYAYRYTLRVLTDLEKTDPVIERLMVEFNQRVAGKLGNNAKLEEFPDQIDIETPHNDHNDYDHGVGLDPIPDRDYLRDQRFDTYLDAEVLLPFVETHQTAKVKRRNLDYHGNRTG